MRPTRRQFIGWGVLAAAALSGGLWLTRLDFTRAISTDVLDLIPAGERTPELVLVRALAGETEARVMLFALTTTGDRPASPDAARQFASALASDPAFAEAWALDDPTPRDAIGRELFDRRLTLLFPFWLHDQAAAASVAGIDATQFGDWAAGRAVTALGDFLATPQALAFQDLVPKDPLLLMPGVLDRLKGGLALLQPSISPKGAGVVPALVWARIAASPLRDEGQAPVFAAIDRATEAVRAGAPGFAVSYTGVNRFAAASKARIAHEVSWLNAVSLAGVLAVAWIFLRGMHRALHLAPPVLLAVLGAWTAVTLAFRPVHIFVFVVGSLLTGVAIDYGFYIYLQPPAYPGEDYWRKVRRLLEPLLASCFTTVSGFALLLASGLPMIRQLGVFVGAGLLCALAAAMVYFSTLTEPYLAARPFRGGRALPPAWRHGLRRGLIVLWLAALPGLARLAWKDDVRELEIPTPTLWQDDARIRAWFGDTAERTIWLTQGPTVAAARDALENFHAWLRAQGRPATDCLSFGAIVPTAADHARAVRFVHEHPEFAGRLRARLEAAGYDAETFTPFFESFARHAATATEDGLAPAVRELRAKLAGPAAMLLHCDDTVDWFVTIVNGPAPGAAPPADAHSVTADQLQSLNRVFARYRQSALQLSLVGLFIVGLGVFLIYGWRRGPRIFAIPCGSCLGVFGLYGWLGAPLNLFHLLGAFLGVCLTHNYAIFSATSAHRREPPPMSVRLSGLTTMVSFGVLAFSAIPVVRALGATVAAMVLAALLVIEFEHFTPSAEPAMPPPPPDEPPAP
jgi:predicted exporter